ncbi:MAG: hypothetical protein IKI34_00865 [Eubacterium sp.]|nr:hypothetical protein [Eubacterium sp.]MBR7060274.1 hypothetical protein [Eubacterium sp.]
MKNKNCCPKCGEKLKPLYMKQNCPKCGVNLMYYKLDERLEEDAIKAQKEVDSINRFSNMLKESTIKTPWHIARLILFFTPLLSMLLPMFWAGHKKVSLLSFIMSIVNHGFDFGALTADKSYLFAILAIIGVIVFSLAVIISSLFSSTKNGFRRNMIFSDINALVFIVLSNLVHYFDGRILAGFIVTAIIYALEYLLHYLCEKPEKRKGISTIVPSVLLIVSLIINIAVSYTSNYIRTIDKESNALRVVSFNLASPWGTSIDGTGSEERVIRFADYMKAASPDLIGTQELNSKWLEKLSKLLPEYESYAVKRGGDSDENTSEMNGIFWNKKIFTAVETKTFWLSKTPEKESRFTFTDENGETKEAGCNRICTYAILKDNGNKKYAFLNTHLDNSSEEAMNFGAELISKEIDEITAKYKNIRVILTGDFNQTSNGKAYKTISEKLINSQLINNELKATYQEWGYRDTGNLPIDFIFISENNKIKGCGYLDDLSEGYISDHYGIYSDIQK